MLTTKVKYKCESSMAKVTVAIAIILMTGCANKAKAFGSQHATLTVSECVQCQKKEKPFYKDGVWVSNND